MKNRTNIYKISGIVIFLDQIIKILIRNTMDLYQEVKVIPNFFSILYEENSGAAFSILQNQTLFLIIISILFLLGIDCYLKKEEKNLKPLSILSFGMIIGGVYGNLLDRILHKKVTDYLSFIFFKYHFPIFNIADIGITIGVLLLIISLWKEKEISKE